MQMLREALGLTRQENVKPEKTTGDEPVMSRRVFLARAAVVGMLGSGSMTQAIAAPSKKSDAIEANIKAIKKLQAKASELEIPPAMNNGLENGIDIYNSLIDLFRDYNAGEFIKNPQKYYKPRTPHNVGLIENFEKDGNGKFQVINLKADYAVVAEIIGTNNFEDLSTKGYAVLKKGTEIMTRTYRDGSGREITENYIKFCFNAIYLHHVLCPPCD